jgi:hypothetical protein
LREKTEKQLEKLAGDSKESKEAYREMLENYEGVKNFTRLTKDTAAGNVAAAQSNLGMQENLETLRAETQVLLDQLRTAKRGFAQKVQLQRQEAQAIDPHALVKKVRAAAEQADEASEDMAQCFIDGEMAVSTTSAGNAARGPFGGSHSLFTVFPPLYPSPLVPPLCLTTGGRFRPRLHKTARNASPTPLQGRALPHAAPS